MTYQNIRYDSDDHVVTITLARPDKRNCINQATNQELQHAWARFRDDHDAFVASVPAPGTRRSAPVGI